MLVLEGLVGLCRTVQFTFFSITGRGIDLDYCDIEWFALEIEIILLFLRLHPCTAFRTLFTMMATPFLQRDLAHSSRYNGHLN